RAIELTRSAMKWPAPCLAEPRPRTRLSGVRRDCLAISGGSRDVERIEARDEAEQQPDGDRADDREHDHHGADEAGRFWVEAGAGVPDEVTDAAERVVERGHGESEQDELAPDRADKA